VGLEKCCQQKWQAFVSLRNKNGRREDDDRSL
jgi:hypothetical protein